MTFLTPPPVRDASNKQADLLQADTAALLLKMEVIWLRRLGEQRQIRVGSSGELESSQRLVLIWSYQVLSDLCKSCLGTTLAIIFHFVL